jgi:hypothetical protein
MYAQELADRFPRVGVDAGPIYIRDGAVATSGGVTAALDLTLAFVEEDHGAELARRVALGMVTYLQRPGNQTQRGTEREWLRTVAEHAQLEHASDQDRDPSFPDRDHLAALTLGHRDRIVAASPATTHLGARHDHLPPRR